MSALALITLFTLVGGVLSIALSYLLVARREPSPATFEALLNVAAGVLIAVAFTDLLPEALEESQERDIFVPAMVGFVLFFFAERFISAFHAHHEHGPRPASVLILFGDGLHNLIDGVAITAAFLTSVPLGVATSIAIVAHEIPQEIGDMSILLANGMSKRRAVLFNFLSSLAALAGALIAFGFSEFVEENVYAFLAVTAGLFLYIAASDLIPELHERFRMDRRPYHAVFFLLGIALIVMVGRIVHE
jgi:zinc and cadmium transporter